MHCDTLTMCYETGQEIQKNDLQLSLERGSCFEKWRQCFAVWFPDGMSDEMAEKTLEGCFEIFKSVPDKNIFTLENAFIASNEAYSPKMLKKRYGVGMLSLTWNAEGRLCGGSSCDIGLTPEGRRIVKECEESGIIIDVSHISDKGFDEVMKCIHLPIAASHSNCRKICPVARNLTDGQIKRIIDINGIIGICFYPEFLGKGEVFERIYEHIMHILSLGGERAVSLGSDFDGARMNKKLTKIENVLELYDFLRNKGLDNGILDDIFYQNAENFFKRFYI